MRVNVIRADRLTPDHITAWSELQRADAAVDNPFFRPEYTCLAGRIRGNVEVAIVEQNGGPVAFFPFERDKGDVGRAVTWRLSDMHGVIAAKGIRWDAKQLVRDARLSVWHFDHLVASQEPFQPYHDRLDPSPYIDLREGFEVFHRRRQEAGSNLIRQAERKARKMAREVGPLRFEMHTTGREALAALLAWKSAQIARWNLVDVFRFDWVIRLLESIRDTETEGFSGRLSALYAGDRVVAVHMGLLSHGVLNSWIPAHDAGYGSYSPGLILHVEMAKRAAEMGVHRIDLGRGLNQLKTGLMSGEIRLAIGSVDRRPIRRALTALRHRAEQIATARLGGAPRRAARSLLVAFRRLRDRSIHD